MSEAELTSKIAQQSGSQIDLDLTAAPPPTGTKERAASALAAAEAALKANQDDLYARLNRVSAHLELGESQKAIDDLDAVIRKSPETERPYQLRAIAHARLGHKDQARADQEKFEIGYYSDESRKRCLAVIVAAELGAGNRPSVTRRSKRTSRTSPGIPNSTTVPPVPTPSHLRQLPGRTRRGVSRCQSEPSACSARRSRTATPIIGRCRKTPTSTPARTSGVCRHHEARASGAILRRRLGGRFPVRGESNLWTRPDRSPPACPELVAQGYRMVALSVARTSPEGPPLTASVWHRPVITEETRDRLAERQARAAVSLLRMGKTDEFIPLLRHSADPRLRSFIINWLSPLGADPKLIVAELDRIDPNAKPTPVQGQQFMDAILFHPETSQRRALILALGTYGTEGLSSGEQEPLIGKLLDLYRKDPDSGIHAAAEWTLRQWKQLEKLQAELDAGLKKLNDRGDRRWYS